ncbi:ParB/RepB/Spo0J family partition protein [Enterovirga sp.]|uniref:ParB/RepB/Spo0J family partition protein n=1 Tax=Enterovirga sp. TaxID=2026350 RepID=UPI002633EC56|nr:ParB/RepB/Spo0J family partition protein [Enterovirga sp.]MDB5590212.1 spo0J [Enterovirga sp.]
MTRSTTTARLDDTAAPRARLGRGLAALIGDFDDGVASSERPSGAKQVPVEFLKRNPRNPRTTFSEAELEDLTASIRERGIIQPIIVRSLNQLPGAFEIIAGERRWRAAQRAGLHEVPVVVVEADDRLALELAIIENVQRSDLNALEEARGYQHLIDEHGYTQADLGTTLGKSRSHIANTLRLLKLPDSVRDLISRGELSAGHGRALLAVPDPEVVARRVVDRGLTVRDVERLGREPVGEGEDGTRPARPGRPRQTKAEDVDARALERDLEEMLGLVVQIDSRGEEGRLTIRYRSLDQLDALCRALKLSVRDRDPG